VLLVGVGPSPDVLDDNFAGLVEVDESLELFEPLPAGLSAVVCLRFEFADNRLRDGDGRVGELAGIDTLGDPAVDDNTRIRDDFHTDG
jgi:hypothetical protein